MSAVNPMEERSGVAPSLLIVDDDPAMVQVLAATVRELGKLRFATSGQAAMRLIGEALPDVVLLDADMPDMDGYDVLRQIKNTDITRDLPVIMVTGYATEAHEKAGLELGAADFIAKPFRPSIVLARVRTQLHLKRISDQLKTLSAIDRRNLDLALIELQSRNAQLIEATGRLQLANQGLLQFIRAASHDLRQPLNTVTQFADLILEDTGETLDAEHQKYLHRIVRAGDHMKGLLDHTVAYARQLHEARGASESVDLNTAMQEAVRALEIPLRDSGLTIICDRLPTVQASPSAALQTIQNLMLNAIQFAHPERPPSLQVSTTFEQSLVRILFRDNGIGIATQHWERVFEPFKRLHRREAIAGNGLGLTVARQMAESYGGTLKIVTSGDEGTVFCLTLRS